MNRFFQKRAFRSAVAVILLLLLLILLCAIGQGHILPTTGFVGRVTAPLRSATNRTSAYIQDKVEVLTKYEDYQRENRELRAQVAALEKQMTDYEQTKKDLADIEGFMGVKIDHEDYELSDPCTIIGYVENDPFHSFYIDKGKNDGLSLYAPVVTSDGLVGVISDISDTYSIVETLLSPSLSVGAQGIGKNAEGAEEKETGIVEGDVTLCADYLCRMRYLEKATTLKTDDLVVTSNSIGLFPQGYLIGKVEKIEPVDSGLSYSAVIRPAVDYENLTNVIVITNFAGKEQENATEETLPAEN